MRILLIDYLGSNSAIGQRLVIYETIVNFTNNSTFIKLYNFTQIGAV